MDHLNTQSPPRPLTRFQVVLDSIAAGAIPLYGDLTRKQQRQGKTDCVLPYVGFDFPGCLALAVCRDGRVQIVAGFNADTDGQWSKPKPTSALEVNAMVENFLLKVKSALEFDDDGSVQLIADPAFSRALVNAFFVAHGE